MIQGICMANDQLSNVGLFLPTNYTWAIEQVNSIDIKPELKELLVQLFQNVGSICLAVNLKDSAYYNQPEFLTGQSFFPDPSDTSFQQRGVFRTVVDFGILPNNATISVAHNIDFADTYSFTRIYGAATDQTGMLAIPLPYVTSAGTAGIQLSVNATDVVITTTGNYAAYTVSYVVLEYLKN